MSSIAQFFRRKPVNTVGQVADASPLAPIDAPSELTITELAQVAGGAHESLPNVGGLARAPEPTPTA